jgi:hypothetical protein
MAFCTGLCSWSRDEFIPELGSGWLMFIPDPVVPVAVPVGI